ncbi:hypothetical protein ACEPAG_3615 [Sanghuangporus baumii]
MPRAMTATPAKKGRYEYEQKKKYCKCRICLPGTDGTGRLRPVYLVKKHAKLDLAARTTEPRRIEPTYMAQPFSRPLPNHQSQQQQQQQQQLAPAVAVAPLSSNDEAEDDIGGFDAWDDGDFEVEVDVAFPQPDVEMQDEGSGESEGLMHSPQIPIELAEPSYIFKTPDTTWDPLKTWNSLDKTFFWRSILALVAWLHLMYHLPHKACNLMLHLLKHIFILLGAGSPGWTPIVTLQAAYRKLGLHDRFLLMPMCSGCHRIFPPDSPDDLECPECQIALFDAHTRTQQKKIKLKYPFFPISQQLAEIIMQPGIEDVMDSWRNYEHKEGEYRDISDGKFWNSLKGPDGKLFFDQSPEQDTANELRIGLTLGFDGFSFTQSKSGKTHSSDVLSFSIANLPIQLRYRPRYLLLTGAAPGPKGLSTEQTQYILEPVVDDLLTLYKHGFIVPMPRFLQGRLCRVVLIAGCMDHIALCKACAMSGHASSNDFCTKCKAPRNSLMTSEGLKDSFPHRSGEENRRLAFEYRKIDDEDEKQEFFTTHGVGYTELSRLPYFDLVRMAVIDPMHNVLLGIMRCQWHDSWIKTNVLRKRTEPYLVQRELDLLNAYVNEFEMPSWLGRLPSEVGYPAAGSLSADEYKTLALVYRPIVIPFVWSEWQPVAAKDHEAALKRWRKKPGSDPEPRIRMHEDEPANFLKLAATLKILLGRSIRDVDIERAKKNLLEYLQGYLKLHPEDVKPNFHWVVHLFDQIYDYGPVYSFWTFIFERLNKVRWFKPLERNVLNTSMWDIHPELEDILTN